MDNVNEKLKIVDAPDDVWELDGSEFVQSSFEPTQNIDKEGLIALLSGRALVDLTDGEYVHWIQLDSEALKIAKTLIH